jgi:hypothetical protein
MHRLQTGRRSEGEKEHHMGCVCSTQLRGSVSEALVRVWETATGAILVLSRMAWCMASGVMSLGGTWKSHVTNYIQYL